MLKTSFNKDIFEKQAEQFMAEYQVPGAGVGLNHNGERLYDHGLGYRNKEEKQPVNADTVFGIASMTKSFTCVAIMQLQDAGKLNVHDKVITHLPEFALPSPGKTEDVTIHHLMTHTTGLPPISVHNLARKRSIDQDPTAKDYGLDVASIKGDPIDTDVELLEKIAGLDVKLLDEPGEAFSYSNESYGVLGAIVNRVSGLSFEDYVIQNILEPANMKDSFFDISEIDMRENVTMLYASKKDGEQSVVYPTPLWWDAPAMRAGGYLKSTVNDILTYLEIFRNGGIVGQTRILSEESVEQMTHPHVEFEPGKYYGYGLRVIPDYYGSKLIEHGGGLKGVSSLMCVVPEKGLTGVVLTNLSDIPAGRLLKGALNVAQNKEFQASNVTYEDYEMDAPDLATCAGTYTSTEGMKVRIEKENDQLTFYSNGTYEPMRCVGKYLFLNKQNEIVRFFTNEQGEVERVYYGSRQIYKDQL